MFFKAKMSLLMHSVHKNDYLSYQTLLPSGQCAVDSVNYTVLVGSIMCAVVLHRLCSEQCTV